MKKIRLSESTMNLLNECERKFQIDRLNTGIKTRLNTPVFSRGHSWGKGVQVYMLTGNMELALYHAWLDYWPILEDDKKSQQHRVLWALQCAKPKLDELRSQYEVVIFHGYPAVELGYRLNIDATFYYVGFIDLVLRNLVTGKYIIFECKYTGWNRDGIDILYRNSGQGVGYSIVLDEIVGEEQSEYGVLYFVCQDKAQKPSEFIFHAPEYAKDLRDRLTWFVTLGMDVQRIKQMRELSVFPMRNASCLSYGRPCPHFGLCHMQSLDHEREDEEDPHEVAGRYSFTYELDAVIANHLSRIES